MPNFDGQVEIIALYDVTIAGRALSHQMTFDVQPQDEPFPGEDPATFTIYNNNGTTTPLSPAVDDMFELVWKLMGTGTSQPRFEMWKYDPEPSLNKTFICAWDGGVTYALGSTAAVAAHQSTYTFRSIGGGYARIQLMEDIGVLETKTVMPTTGDVGALRAGILGAGGIVRARDGGKLISAMHACYGQNEKLKRKRYRQE